MAVAAALAVVLRLREHVQFQAVFRLQVDHQLVHVACGCAVDGVRRGAEVDLDACVARGQPLAGADVEGHAGPAPVGDFGAQRHEGFGAAVGVHARLVAVALHALAVGRAGRVLAAHRVQAQALGRPGLEGAQHLELFVADGVGVRVDGRLHGHGAQQLQRVVLHHVAQRAGLVVEGAALFHAQVLGHGDLDVGDVLAAPDGLEERVAEAHREQVLHRRLAQVVVDAKDLLLLEHLAHRGVDGAVGGQVVAQRLLEHDAGARAVEPGGGDLLDHLREERGRRGHVHHDRLGVALLEQVGQAGVVGGLGQVHAQVVQHGGELLELLGGGALGAFDGAEARLDQLAVLVVRQVVACHADDAPVLRQAAVPEGLEQRGHQLAPRKVASTAEQNEIEAHEKTFLCLNAEQATCQSRWYLYRFGTPVLKLRCPMAARPFFIAEAGEYQ
ncbi:hypothetical protein D3C72_979060 [compost metagenome]